MDLMECDILDGGWSVLWSCSRNKANVHYSNQE